MQKSVKNRIKKTRWQRAIVWPPPDIGSFLKSRVGRKPDCIQPYRWFVQPPFTLSSAWLMPCNTFTLNVYRIRGSGPGIHHRKPNKNRCPNTSNHWGLSPPAREPAKYPIRRIPWRPPDDIAHRPRGSGPGWGAKKLNRNRCPKTFDVRGPSPPAREKTVYPIRRIPWRPPNDVAHRPRSSGSGWGAENLNKNRCRIRSLLWGLSPPAHPLLGQVKTAYLKL